MFATRHPREAGHHIRFDFDREAFSRTFISHGTNLPKRRVISFDKSRKEGQEKCPFFGLALSKIIARGFSAYGKIVYQPSQVLQLNSEVHGAILTILLDYGVFV
jgi:hypothetical protein